MVNKQLMQLFLRSVRESPTQRYPQNLVVCGSIFYHWLQKTHLFVPRNVTTPLTYAGQSSADSTYRPTDKHSRQQSHMPGDPLIGRDVTNTHSNPNPKNHRR